MVTRVPRLTINWHLSEITRSLSVKNEVFPNISKNKIQIGHKFFSNIIEKFETKNRSVVIVGSPILNGSLDRGRVAKWVAEKLCSIRDIKLLNGEFLIFIFDKEEQKLTVFNDRFASYPFFWATNKKEFAGSYVYLDLAKKCKSWRGFSLRLEKAYEFFLLQRLMGVETHDNLTKFLPAGSALVLRKNGTHEIHSYWSRLSSGRKTTLSNNIKEKFVSLFKNSVLERLPEEAFGSRASVFLSGGHDSRLVAAYGGSKVTCLTLGFTDNQEVSCARSVALALGSRHVYEKLDCNYFEKTLIETGYLSSGMYAIDHALFLYPPDKNIKSGSTFLHGHGLDYMFQGMYLHAKNIKLFGRTTYLKQLKSLPPDIAAYFIENVSFRLKHRYSKYFQKKSKILKKCEFQLYETVKRIENEAIAFDLNEHQIWEHLIFHQPSRHYTFSNVLSKRSRGEVRTPTFDNSLYDFYLSLRPKDRINASLMAYAMKSHETNIGKIPAGNHGMPAGLGPWGKTFLLIVRKVLKELTGLRRFSVPSDTDRTWPDRKAYIKSHPAYWDKLLEPLNDEHFKTFLSFIDWKKLNRNTSVILNEPGGASFMVTLLSYYSFYKALYEKK